MRNNLIGKLFGILLLNFFWIIILFCEISCWTLNLLNSSIIRRQKSFIAFYKTRIEILSVDLVGANFFQQIQIFLIRFLCC